MKINKTKPFALRVKEKDSQNKSLLSNDILFLYDYNNIIERINKEVAKQKTSNNLILFLTHYPTNNQDIIISNKDEWDFFYNYDIIKECIRSNNNMIIDYKFANKLTQSEKNLRGNKIHKIIEYIIDKKIPKDYYLKVLCKFLNKENLLEKFQLFLLNELKTLDLKEIINGKDNYNIFESSYCEINNEKYFTEKNKNTYLIKSEEFQKLLNNNISNIMKSLKSLNSINDIINEKKDQIANIVNFKEKYEEANKIENSVIENSLLNLMNTEIEIEKILDEKNNLIKYNPETYYSGIEILKEDLKREYLLRQ